MPEPATPPAGSADQQRLLAERYGARPSRRRLTAIVAGALAIVGLAWLVWAWSAADSAIEAEVINFEVVSSSRVEVELLVHHDGSGPVSCTVAAKAADSGVVGETEVVVPPGSEGEQRIETTVVTERAARTVELAGCE